MQRTVALISLGCAKNLVNSEQMLALLTDAGYTLAPEADGADAVVVNTCGFIDAAKREAIDTILELADLKNAERLRAIIVAGCLAERYRDDIISDMPEVDAVVGVGSFSEIVSAVDAALAGERTVFAARAEDADDNLPRVLTAPGAWTYLKIADGCDNACAFCVIPSIRGSYRSREMSDIAAEAEELSARGVRELILIAQDTTRYGADLYGAPSLALLLARLEQIPLLRWIRVHYMYPDMVNDALLDKFASSEKLLPYFDIPIQHINDGILRKMRRLGTGAEIRELIAKIRAKLPRAVIRTSLIAGLPGEGEAEFNELCDFLRTAQLERAGVFTFSPEEGTEAYGMRRPDGDTARERAELIGELQSRVMDDFNAARVGTIETVLTDGLDEDGRTLARSYAESPDIDGYIVLEGENLADGTFYLAEITAHENGTLTARAVKEKNP